MVHHKLPDDERASDRSWRQDVASLKRMVPYLWPRDDVEIRVRVVGALICIALGKLANVLVPFVYKYAVDALAAQFGDEAGAAGAPTLEPSNLLVMIPLGLILAYGGARFLSLAFNQFREMVFAKVGARAIRRASVNVLAHLGRLSLRFHLDRKTGSLSRSLERGTRAIQDLVSVALFNVIPTIIEIVLVTAILATAFGAAFAVATLITVVVYIAFTIRSTNWRIGFRRDMNKHDNAANARAVDSLLNYETVKAFGNEDFEVRQYDTAMGRYEAAAVKSQTSLAVMNLGQAAIMSVGVTVLMFMAARGIAQGEMTLGDFVLVNTYMLQLGQPLNFFGFVYRAIKQALVDLERMFGLLDQAPEIADAPGAGPLTVSGGAVAFENVDFAYNPDRQILQGVSFAVPAGAMVALVGASGSGKTTVGRLLFRSYDVTGGRIVIDGQDIRSCTQASLHAAIGVVPQDAVLFNDTIGYNIGYAKVGADQAAIERAARLAHIHDFIASLPQGYDTVVGERGLKLSGGEKQRVAIARVILKDAPILIFDEATSALDTHTEKEIQSNLRDVARGRTTLVIAHRLSTVVDADEILVMDAGRIIERGRHADLIAADGPYARMWARQQERQALETALGETLGDAASDGEDVPAPLTAQQADR